MAIQSANLYNAAVAGIAGGVSSGRQPSSNNTVSANIAAAAAAVDAAIGAVSGGGTSAQAELVQSLCYAAFDGKQAPTAVQADYAAQATLIAAEYNAAKAGFGPAPIGKTILLTGVVFPAYVAPPTACDVVVVDAQLIGGSAFLATIQRLNGPSTGSTTVAALTAYPADALPSAIGALLIVLAGAADAYAGATENVAVQVMR